MAGRLSGGREGMFRNVRLWRSWASHHELETDLFSNFGDQTPDRQQDFFSAKGHLINVIRAGRPCGLSGKDLELAVVL